MRAVITMALILFSATRLGAQPPAEPQFETYEDMRALVGTFYEEEKFEELAELLQWGREQFPDNLMANSFNLALAYVQLEQHERALDAFEYALERGTWFGTYSIGNEIWAPLKEHDRFAEIEAKNEALRLEAQKLAKPDRIVVTPEDFDEKKTYPLFIALHGGGGNMTEFKDVWKSEKLRKEFIVAYLQSSLVTGMNQFTWTEDIEITKREIADAYAALLEEYRIDKGEVIVGGFSSGGVASLEIAISNTVPMVGFVVLCPGRPETFTEETVATIKKNSIRATILTTEMDQRLAEQQEMAELLNRAGVPYQFIVTPDIGHWIPEDLDAQIDSAIAHIRGK